MSDQPANPGYTPEGQDGNRDPSPPHQNQSWQQASGQGAPQYYGVTQWQGQNVAPKNPAVSLIASLLIPGLGSILNGQVGKGVLFIVSDFFAWLGFLLLAWIFVGFLFLPVLFVIWVWAMVDAYQGAQRWNARHGIIS